MTRVSITTVLKRIVGRIKKMHHSEYYMMVAIMAMPLGFGFLIQGGKVYWFGVFFLVFGMVAWVAGLLTLTSEAKQRRDDREVTNSLIKEARVDFTLIVTELKGLRSDIKDLGNEIRERKDGSDNPPRTDNH